MVTAGNIGAAYSQLLKMTLAQLRREHVRVFGERTKSRHREHLIKRIIWKLQANAEGDLTERARKRARELAKGSDVRLSAPDMKSVNAPERTITMPAKFDHDRRVPMPGAILEREYKGRTLEVRVLAKGFEFEGKIYRSLTAIAEAVTGSHWNGYDFFDLKG